MDTRKDFQENRHLEKKEIVLNKKKFSKPMLSRPIKVPMGA